MPRLPLRCGLPRAVCGLVARVTRFTRLPQLLPHAFAFTRGCYAVTVRYGHTRNYDWFTTLPTHTLRYARTPVAVVDVYTRTPRLQLPLLVNVCWNRRLPLVGHPGFGYGYTHYHTLHTHGCILRIAARLPALPLRITHCGCYARTHALVTRLRCCYARFIYVGCCAPLLRLGCGYQFALRTFYGYAHIWIATPTHTLVTQDTHTYGLRYGYAVYPSLRITVTTRFTRTRFTHTHAHIYAAVGLHPHVCVALNYGSRTDALVARLYVCRLRFATL